MRSAAVSFILAVVIAGWLTPLVRAWAQRLGFLDHALSARKVHGRPVPRVGGIAIVLAFYAPLFALFFVSSEVGRLLWHSRELTVALLLGGFGIAALGVYDDVYGSRARTKLSVQLLIAVLMYWAGYRIDCLANPFGKEIYLGAVGMPFTVLWIVGITNAMNLIDGLDGLAGGVALIGLSTIFTICAIDGDPLMLLFTAALAGAVIGFLFYNFNPATIFMGDSGSMFLGFVLATTSIRSNQKASTAVALAIPILALGVPIADTLLAVVRRALRGAPLFSADRGHIHHRLMDRGMSHLQSVLLIYTGAIVLGGGAIMLRFASRLQAALVLLAEAALVFIALRVLGYVDLSKTHATLSERRRNLEMRAAMRRVGEALRAARTPQELWFAVRAAAEPLGASAVALSLGRLMGREGSGPWSEGLETAADSDAADAGLLRARYGLNIERPGDDHIELGWSDGRISLDRGTQLAIELLCDQIAVALDRIERTWCVSESGKVFALRR